MEKKRERTKEQFLMVEYELASIPAGEKVSLVGPGGLQGGRQMVSGGQGQGGGTGTKKCTKNQVRKLQREPGKWKLWCSSFFPEQELQLRFPERNKNTNGKKKRENKRAVLDG